MFTLNSLTLFLVDFDEFIEYLELVLPGHYWVLTCYFLLSL